MSKLSGGRKMILCLVVLAAVIFTDVNEQEAKVLMTIVGGFSVANAIEHVSQRGK